MHYRAILVTTISMFTFFFLVADNVAFSQTSRWVALRTVSGEPNNYITVNNPCGPNVTLESNPTSQEAPSTERQVFKIVDLNGGNLNYGDKIRIKKCRNYLRVNSEGGLDSVPPINPDGSPDSATVFTVLAPGGTSPPSSDIVHLILEAEVSNKKGFYISAPLGPKNGRGKALKANSDFAGNPRNVFKLIPLTLERVTDVTNGIRLRYQTNFGRPPTLDELDEALENLGTNLDVLLSDYLNTLEGSEERRATIRRAYQYVLGRNATTSEIDQWKPKPNFYSSLIKELTDWLHTGVIHQQEIEDLIYRAFANILNRPPSHTELTQWESQIFKRRLIYQNVITCLPKGPLPSQCN